MQLKKTLSTIKVVSFVSHKILIESNQNPRLSQFEKTESSNNIPKKQ